VGRNGDYGQIFSSYSTGTVSGDVSVGGFVGGNSGIITSSSSTGTVSGNMHVGGLVGSNQERGSITSSSSTGTVSGDLSVGGLVGTNLYYGHINTSYSTSAVSGNEYVGGLVGENSNDCRIASSYSSGTVRGGWRVGGLVGDNLGSITSSYSTGTVSGDVRVGGLVGENWWGEFTDSFWDIETSGQATSDGGTGKTTPEMQDPNTFMEAGWNFVGQPDGPHDIWAEPVGGGYPILWWQLSPLPELPFSGGTGKPDEPYLISTANELNSIGHNPRLMGAHFKLINDIDLTGVDLFIIGNEVFPFTGVFDGNGKKIYNFTYTSTDTGYVGLFSYVEGKNAEIKDLGLIDPNIDAGTGGCVGSLTGWLEEGTITNCYVVGGSVSGEEIIGGLVGNNHDTITNCYSTGKVSGNWYVGGLVGRNYTHGSITSSYSSGTVRGGWGVGGLVGRNLGSITSSYSTGSVIGDTRVGGLVGNNYLLYDREGNYLTNCYSTGLVNGTGDNVGGLVGYNEEDYIIAASFWDVETSSQTTSAGGTGKTTTEMQTAGTFLEAGWDFVDETENGTEDIWCICEGADYPKLTWQFIPGDFNEDYNVDLFDLAILSGRWSLADSVFFWCRGADLTGDGFVGFNDLEVLAENWLAGISVSFSQ
jgi:hypothetical protein